MAPGVLGAEGARAAGAGLEVADAGPRQEADLASGAAKQPVRIYTGEEIEALLREVYASPPELIARVRAMTRCARD